MNTLLWIVAAFGVVCIALAVLIVLYILAQRKHKLVKAQRDRLNTRNAELYAQNADLREALTEATSHIGNLQIDMGELQQQLDHATIPLAEVAPEPVKRTRKKAGQA